MSQLRHKKVREAHLYSCRNATGAPVLHALDTSALRIGTNELSHFRGPTQLGDQFGIGI